MTAADYDLTYIALGAGLDSTVLLCASELGLEGVPRADLAIFADVDGQLPVEETAEPAYVLRHVWWLAERAARTPGAIPVHVVAHRLGLVRGQRARLLTGHGKGANPPLFTREEKVIGTDLFGDPAVESADGQLRRQCTPTFKIEEAERYVRRLLGLRQVRRRRDGTWPVRVRGLIGISADEAHRVKPSGLPWITLEHPLVWAGIGRKEGAALLREHGWPVPEKSACVFCSYHGDDYWAWLRREHPEEFAKAVRYDAEFRQLRGVRGQTFVHSSRRPLATVRFDGAPDGWGNECAGLCGA